MSYLYKSKGLYHSPRNPYSFNYDSSVVDSYANALSRLDRERNKMQTEQNMSDAMQPPRSNLTRAMDALMVGSHATAGFVDGLVKMHDDPNRYGIGNAFNMAWKGIKASNPFGDVNQNDQYTYSRVLGDAGWNPTDTEGKIIKGIVGFAGDVLLDPLTYVSGGLEALVKGTGRVGQIGSKLLHLEDTAATSIDAAKSIITKQAAQAGRVVDPAMLERDSALLSRKMNEYKGVREPAKVTVGLGNLPFMSKFGTKELPGVGKALQTVGDHTIAPVYQKLRQSIYGSRIGELFSPKSPMYRMAQTNPAEFYNTMRIAEDLKGANFDKVTREAAIRDHVKTFNLEPDEERQLIEALQDHTNFHKVSQIIHLARTQEGSEYAQKLQTSRDHAKSTLDSILERKKQIEELQQGSLDKAGHYSSEIERLQQEQHDALASLKVEHLSSVDDINKALDTLRGHASTLEDGAIGLHSPLKPKEPVYPDAPVKPTRPYTKSPETPAFEPIPNEPKLPAERQLLHDQRVGLVKKWKEVKESPEHRHAFIDELSKHLYGEEGAISKITHPNDIEKIVHELNKGRAPDDVIAGVIEPRQHFFDGRAEHIYPHLAKKYNYNKGTVYDGEWANMYDKQVTPMIEQMKNGKPLSQNQMELFTELEHIRANRASDLHYLKKMDTKQLMSHISEFDDAHLLESLRGAVGSNYNPGGMSIYLDKEGNIRYRYHDKEARMTQDEMDAARREKFTAEDRALVDEKTGKDLRTGEFDDKTVVHTPVNRITLKSEHVDDIKGRVLNDLMHYKDGKFVGQHLKPENLTASHMEYASSVVNEAEDLLKSFFKKPYEELSPDQKNLLYGMASKNAYARSMGGKLTTLSKDVSTKAAQAIKLRSVDEHIKSVIREAHVGDEITILKGGKGGTAHRGNITSTSYDATTDTKTYSIKDWEGNIVNDIRPTEIFKVNKRPVKDIVADSIKKTKEERNLSRTELEKEKVLAEHEQRVQAVKDLNESRLAEHQKELDALAVEKGIKREAYLKDKEKYDKAFNKHLRETENLRLAHEADIHEWETAIRENSRTADEYFAKKEAFHAELEQKVAELKQAFPSYFKKAKQLTSAFVEKKNILLNKIKVMELDAHKYATTLANGKFAEIDMYVQQIHEADVALANDDALEAMMKVHLSEGEIKDIIDNNSMHNTEIVLDSRTDIPEKVKLLIKSIRHDFVQVASKEVKIGSLKQEQADAWLWEYLPHVLSPDGEKFVKGNMELLQKEAGLTHDFGFGETYNPFSESRTIKWLKTADGWIKKPTIAQINEHFAPMLQGKNLFSENIADIYLTRMLKHEELMYDNTLMHSMLLRFGKDIPNVTDVEDGYKAVMNVGMFKKTMRDMSSLHVSMHIGDEVGYFVSTLPRDLPPDMVSKEIDKFLKEHFPDDVVHQLAKNTSDEFMNLAGFNLDTFAKESTPMLELEKGHIERITNFYHGTMRSFQSRITKRMDNMAKYGADAAQIERFQKMRDKFDSVSPLQIKQVNDAIVLKANQARKIQIARDESRMLRLYDKSLHLIKLNQTTVMPAFHLRNKSANTFLNWMGVGQDAFNPQFHLATNITAFYKGDTVKLQEMLANPKYKNILKPVVTVQGDVYHWDELYSLAVKHGVVDEGFFAKDIGANASTKGIVGGKFDPTDTENFFLYKFGGKVGNNIENGDRLLHFASMLRQGHTAEQAAESADKFLFDYADLTGFERGVMKRIFPYYTWLRKNSRLQISQLIEQPEKMRLIAKELTIFDSAVDPQDKMNPAFASPFVQDWKQLPFNYNTPDGKKEPILWNPNLPFMDLSRIPRVDPMHPIDATIDSVKTMFTQTAPQLKVPIELGANYNTFFDKPIIDSKDDSSTIAGKWLDYLGTQNALYTAGKGVVQKQGMDLALHGLNTLTGNKFLSYDYETSKNMAMARYIDRMKNPTLSDQIAEGISHNVSHTIQNAVKLFQFTFGDAMHTLVGQKPRTADEYGGALRPISTMAYDSLPAKEKAKYTPPTKSDAMAYNKQAEALSKRAYEQSGVIKRFTWMLMDVVGVDKKQDFQIGHVTKVIDGDTFHVNIGGKNSEVRMLLVDTPETVHPNKPIMPMGHEASNYSKKTLSNKDVKLIFDGSRVDKYGRTLAYVEVDGQDYNKSLVEKGLADVRYTQRDYPNNTDTFSRTNEYYSAEQRAAKKKLGIWQDKYKGYATPGVDQEYNFDAVRKYLLQLNKDKAKANYFPN